MKNRAASISFNGYIKPATALEHPGLPQGSPLSPILFAFYNADLVDQLVDFTRGASAYIDDYFQWRSSLSASKNLAALQREDIPRIQRWVEQTGSSFKADKTELIQFTRRLD